MRSRAVHLAFLLLLLSSLAVSDARASSVEPTRTPGGVFVRNLLLQAANEESEPVTPGPESEAAQSFTAAAPCEHAVVRPVNDAAVQTAHVHAVTGSSL
ncbi:hypothetical protein [Terriglobus sp. RCC_193]|uniref:hypothetical protein n=1 Tax=Terriglobus sp. RCC_193 TaxID=3239218 RepID=UPI003525D98D